MYIFSAKTTKEKASLPKQHTGTVSHRIDIDFRSIELSYHITDGVFDLKISAKTSGKDKPISTAILQHPTSNGNV